jgi:hypothetical protein
MPATDRCMPRKSKSHTGLRPAATAQTNSSVATAPSALASEAPLPPMLTLNRLTPLQIALLARGQVRSYSPLDD